MPEPKMPEPKMRERKLPQSKMPERKMPDSNGSSKHFLMVALGASAGGLEACEAFFKHMPADAGMTFAVVMHLAPDHSSALAEILGRHTRMTVEQAQDNTRVLPNHVYIIPPNATLTVKDGLLSVAPPDEPRGHRTPIDSLFRSLAEDYGENAVCIMLSGTGTDGTLGLTAVKENGGMAMAQTLESAKYDAILRSAIATGLVDHILPVESMPAKLLEYAAHLTVLNGSHHTIRQQIGKHLGKIHGWLRKRCGHDFSQYKESTIARRVERRMKALQIDTVEHYVKTLEEQPEECDRLFKDLLIGVTQFFRNPEGFEVLAHDILPKLFEGKEGDDQVRVCVVGCASGEEAYTLGILLCEQAQKVQNPPKIQIFATDIDDRGLETARKGFYPDSIAQQVSAGRLERFFLKQADGYQVKPTLREMVLFSTHSFIKDPPFSRLDLISCRNVLIYLGPELQQKVVPLFHFALRAGGYLFLGPSENISSHPEMFRTIDKKHRIFERNDARPAPGMKLPFSGTGRPGLKAAKDQETDAPDLPRQLQRLILEQYGPACVIVKETGEAVYFSGKISSYLQHPAGSPETNVINMAREGLRIPLRTALHRAVTQQERTVQKKLPVQTNGHVSHVDLTVDPITAFAGSHLYMILLEEVAPVSPLSLAASVPHTLPDSGSDEIIRHLESELRSAHENAQAAFEELETANEELQSANEEYQSTNEELETSKEEMQSSHEELETVNAELSRRVSELDRINSDLQNLFAGTQIATIFLDGEMRIKSFTPAAGSVFRLIPGDVGRPLTDLAGQFTGVALQEDITEVLKTLVPRERQLSLADGRHHQMLILPYRTIHNVIDGVVITFTDVTHLKQAQQEAEDARTFAENIIRTVRDPLLVLDADLRVEAANQYFYDTFQVSARETLNTVLYDLGNGQWDIPELRRLLTELLPEKKILHDFRVKHLFRGIGQKTMLLNARQIQRQDGGAPLILLAIEDVTARELVNDTLAHSEVRYRAMFDSSPVAVFVCDTSAVIQDYNHRAQELWGRAPRRGDPSERYCGSLKLFLPDGSPLPLGESPIVGVLRTGVPARNVEVTIERPDLSRIPVIVNFLPLINELGVITGAITSFDDLTELKQAQELVRTSEAQAQSLINAAPIGICMLDAGLRISHINPMARPLFELIGDPIGLALSDLLGQSEFAGPMMERFRHTRDTGETYRDAEFAAVPHRAYYDWQIHRIALPGGQSGVVCYFTDITNHVLARQALFDSEQRLSFMAESMPQKIFTATPNGSVNYLNALWMGFTGLPLDQMLGWGWDKFIYPADLEESVRVWMVSLETGAPFEFVHRFRRFDGTYRWHLTRAHAMRDAAGEISLWLGSSTDIHEEKRIEEELRRLNEDLNQFAFAASHDLLEPLRMITSYSELLLESCREQVAEEASIYVGFISQGTQRMRGLLSDLLSFTEVGGGEAAVEPVDLEIVLGTVIQNLQAAIKESGTVLTHSPLPTVWGRQVHFVQLLQNLVSNAIKYRGKISPVVHVSAEQRHGEWLFAVADNGRGIAAEYHGQVFGVFKRLHGKEIPGTGIGLAICQRVVERRGGRIWVESEVEQGAKFCFTLPLENGGNR